jgi:hypothetical protein
VCALYWVDSHFSSVLATFHFLIIIIAFTAVSILIIGVEAVEAKLHYIQIIALVFWRHEIVK